MLGSVKEIWHFIVPRPIRSWIYGIRKYLYNIYIEWIKHNKKKTYANYLYKKTFGYDIDWKHPRDINEVINVLAFTSDTSEWTRLADKYRVRQFIKERGCEEILIPLYGVWERAEDIDFDSLPEKFVLKCNNGYGDVFVINEKSKMNASEVIFYFRHALHRQFGLDTCEPHYLKIKPCIIAEQLLQLGDKGILDYKIWCFDGEPYFIYVCYNRNHITHIPQRAVFDLQWNRIDYCLTPTNRTNIFIEKPQKLQEMLQYARILSKGFPQVRVDFYNINGHIYFGEMTFTSTCGRMNHFTKECLREMGRQVKIT